MPTQSTIFVPSEDITASRRFLGAESAELLMEEEVSDLWRIPTPELRRMRMQGTGPAFVYVRRGVVRYQRADLLDWIRTKRRLAMPDHTAHNGELQRA